MAVALGPYLALYDPVTNALLQALTTPECQSISSAHFVGCDGRYLVAVGTLDVVLWDLVTQTGKVFLFHLGSSPLLIATPFFAVQWHYRSPSPIEAVIPHPKTETFALLQSTPFTIADTTSNTRILIFQPKSSLPSRTHIVPFKLRNISWYPVTSRPQATKDSLPFSLVGITQTWSVVLFGSHVQAPSDEGSSAKELVGGAGETSRRTLFQDVFGKSAFADVTTQPSSVPSLASQQQPWNGKSVEDIFDIPAYLMPPVESLFDSLMEDFVKLRSTDPDESKAVGADEEEEEDVGMDVDVDEKSVVVVREQTRRTFDAREMDDFVQLFRQHAIKGTLLRPSVSLSFAHPYATASGPSPKSIPRPLPNGAPTTTTNGTHKPPNGVAHPKKLNGHAASPSETSQAYPSPASSPAHSTTPMPPTQTSPAVVGKKRKKSLAS